MITRVAVAAILVGAAAGFAFPEPAVAHALVGRQDLPIPEWLFAWGASLVLIVSFVAMTIAWRRPLLAAEHWRPAPGWLSRLLVNSITELLAGALGVFLLAATVWAGLQGTDDPTTNFALTFVFVTFWLGLVALSVLFGDVFRALNPWRAIARACGRAFRLVARQAAEPPFRYPEWLGRWPAVAGLIAFLWLELVYGQSGFGTVGLTPRTVAIATIAYSSLTFAGMALFGTETWLRRGETFSVYFAMFARLSPLEVREGRLGFRRPLSGLSSWVGTTAGSVALVLVTIGGTAFDGAQEGALQGTISGVFEWMIDLGLDPTRALRITNTFFFTVTLAAVAAIYWAGVWGMRNVRGSPSLDRLGRAFGHAFVTIALAYLVAHYFSLVVFQEQAQFTYLLSDPLGDGSDYFGTASSGIDYGLISATAVWYIQVGVLVVGHVLALALGHDRALTVYGEPRLAARSQYWMLALMVGFTSLGLFLLSQANQ
ncbi:MAG: fenitrothion hydrolase [Actinomycetota bacterium]